MTAWLAIALRAGTPRRLPTRPGRARLPVLAGHGGRGWPLPAASRRRNRPFPPGSGRGCQSSAGRGRRDWPLPSGLGRRGGCPPGPGGRGCRSSAGHGGRGWPLPAASWRRCRPFPSGSGRGWRSSVGQDGRGWPLPAGSGRRRGRFASGPGRRGGCPSESGRAGWGSPPGARLGGCDSRPTRRFTRSTSPGSLPRRRRLQRTFGEYKRVAAAPDERCHGHDKEHLRGHPTVEG